MVTSKRKPYNSTGRYFELTGLSTDFKPVKDVNNGSEFYEIDTGLMWYFDEEHKVWVNSKMGTWQPKCRLKGIAYKYCTWHNLTVSLYKLKDNGNPLIDSDYESTPAFSVTTKKDVFPSNTTAYPDTVPFTIEGYGMSGHTYKFKMTTTNAIDYIYLGLTLTQDNADGPSGTDSYTWTIKDRIGMIPGDVAGGNSIENYDLTLVKRFSSLTEDWGWTLPENAETDPTGWAKSVYNPDCLAGRANVNGDDFISTDDERVVRSNLGKTLEDNDPFPGLVGDK